MVHHCCLLRLWTLHPKYLDSRGLVALWREALLAQKVLQGGTKGYRNHPQLLRFRATADPRAAIATYLAAVWDEANRRGYSFDAGKIASVRMLGQFEETDGQLQYEWLHLRRKLALRDPERLEASKRVAVPEPHPLFEIIPGGVREWERAVQE
jgi:hypothetical protein